MWTAWNVWNTEPTVPSIGKNKLLKDKIVVELNNISYTIDVYDTPLGQRWIDALRNNLQNKRILEKNFCFLGFADSHRDLRYLVNELNKNIELINSFEFQPPYANIHPFVTDDFQYSSSLPIGKSINGDQSLTPGKRLKHDSCNLLHRYFEELQGTTWKLSNFYKQANTETKYAIRQLNNLCHEIEGWVNADRKKAFEPEWMRASQITTFLNAPRYNLQDDDFELFKENRYDRELGGVYLHWSQVGKTLYEVFRDEHAPKMTEALCSEINHQKYYSGEFDVEWGQTVTDDTCDWKLEETNEYRKWLAENNFDWEDAKLSLGYIKLGQIDLMQTFGASQVTEIHDVMSKNLNITNIKVIGENTVECNYPYNLNNDGWKQMQMDTLREGYESRTVR